LSTTLIHTSIVDCHDSTLFCGYHNEKVAKKLFTSLNVPFPSKKTLSYGNTAYGVESYKLLIQHSMAGNHTVSVNASSLVTTILAPAGSQIMFGRMSTRMRLYTAWFSFFERV